MLVTASPREEVEAYFRGLESEDFARAGAVSTREVVLTQEMVEVHPVSMVELFRKLGMPVEVRMGKVSLVGGQTRYVLCKEGKVLNAEICKVLVHFGIKLSTFRVSLLCRWNDGDFEIY